MQRVVVAFEDVAVYFSAEEWLLLARWQRELYQEVMMDNYDLVACLDSLDTKSPIVHGMDPREASHGGDRGTLDSPGGAPWDDGTPGDSIQGHRVPPEPGCPPLRPAWGGWGPAGAAGPQICRVCGQSFEDAAALSAHRAEHGDPTPRPRVHGVRQSVPAPPQPPGTQEAAGPTAAPLQRMRPQLLPEGRPAAAPPPARPAGARRRAEGRSATAVPRVRAALGGRAQPHPARRAARRGAALRLRALRAPLLLEGEPAAAPAQPRARAPPQMPAVRPGVQPQRESAAAPTCAHG
ncbi:basic proline-rich protein-like isoform X2 [Gallus gallus]|uniref:basic proline-rich protein-like isoform X2 n=1 Tax=Gallus gallus TaxID=9031 RepID=UPI001AEB616A|nr:basic proline-rich protein-like isoform X2 [Gallus gallus]